MSHHDKPRPSMAVPALALAVLVLLGVAALVAHVSSESAVTARERHAAERKAAYDAGYAAGREAAPVTYTHDRHGNVLTATPAPRRGPLGLTGFTADQVKRLHCYLEEKPGDRRVELPPRDQYGRVVREPEPEIQKP